ncbi:TPA: BRCT domain-containing protein [Escherichia coli]|nr:BRCT domain-containing protein [Escherichia coli]
MKKVCFTGFKRDKKDELTELAKSNGFIVTTDVRKGGNYLCYGESPGPTKLAKAADFCVHVVSETEFRTIIDSSDCPEKAINNEIKNNSVSLLPEINSVYDEHPLLDYLWDAVDKRKIISIIYHGGSSEDARDIIPLVILDDRFLLRAIDLNYPTKPVKNFSIEKIEIPGVDCLSVPHIEKIREKKKRDDANREYKDIEDVHLKIKHTLEGMGWHVAIRQKYGMCYRIDVCDWFLNGKPRKTPVVNLVYEVENNLRPYVCRNKFNGEFRCYEHLDNAVAKFLEWATEVSFHLFGRDV